LIKKSEEAGLQILGPENIAIVKIILVSVLLSAIFESSLVFFFNTHTAFLNLLHGTETISIVKGVSENKYQGLFFVCPFLAILINGMIKIYSVRMKKQMEHSIPVFTVQQWHTEQNSSDEKYSVSLGSVIGIPSIFIFTIFSSFANRELRLTFFCPFTVMLFSVVFPLIIILKIRTCIHILRSTVSNQWETNFMTFFPSL
jgi:hypothetical protein